MNKQFKWTPQLMLSMKEEKFQSLVEKRKKQTNDIYFF